MILAENSHHIISEIMFSYDAKDKDIKMLPKALGNDEYRDVSGQDKGLAIQAL